MSVAVGTPRAGPGAAIGRARAAVAPAVAPVAVLVLAAVLRLVAPGRTPVDPFYDAAVRSMGASWHAFAVGALDPAARVAIDKPPLDLWLQVASTRLLGFTRAGLLLPAALGGTLAVAALYDLLHTLAGRRAALAGALVLAALPIAVVTSRSDTMDSVMAALMVAAFAVAARGLRPGRARNMVAAGALLGLAFEVKLFEALLAAAPLALLWLAGAAGPLRRRLAAVAGAGAACVAAGLAWLVAVTVAVPAASRPWAFGSTNGSPWNAAFVYDGWDRITGVRPAGAAAGSARHVPAPAGPLRLLSLQDHLLARFGVALLVAWVAVAAVLALRAWRPLDRAGRAGAAALVAWLALGTVLFSVQRDLRPRYLEAVDPAVAACVGVALTLLARAGVRRVAALALAGVATASFAVSVAAVSAHAEDSGAPGALAAARLGALSAYLRTHQGGARYEVASLAVSPAAALVARDGRPVLPLGALDHPLLTPAALARAVAAGQVRIALVGHAGAEPHLRALAAWIRAHGTDVSAAAGQPRRGSVYALR